MKNKIRILFLIFFLLFTAILVKLFYIQVLRPKVNGYNQYLKTRKIFPERGKIYDRNNQPMAVNQSSFLLYVEPKKIKNKLEVVRKLNSILNIGESTLESKINRDKVWVAVKSGLDKVQKDKIEALKIKGLGFDYGFRRYYPEASLAAHLIGFLGKNIQGEDFGYFGIEGYYNKDLFGLPGFIKTERDIKGRPMFIGTQDKIESENGRDLILTIDKSVQGIAKRRLKQGIEKYEASSGCIIVAEPETMQILALVCLPDFDPSKFNLFSEKSYKNPVISNVYEPGSIFKPLIMAAALEEKVVKPGDFYDETGPVTVGEYTINTWDDKYEGKITMTRILEKSSNVGMVYVGRKLGRKNILKYLKKYQFGEKTGVDLQGENSGFLKKENQWYPIDYATITFGQGIAVTPIQILRAFTAIINGGRLYKPYVVGKIRSETSLTVIKPQLVDRVISKRTSKIIKKMLVSTVENGVVNWRVPEGYTIGGKTGTAQIPIKGKYDPSKTIASYMGFVPAEKPRFTALVVLRETKTSPWGSETAAPIFFELARDLLVYYNISPER